MMIERLFEPQNDVPLSSSNSVRSVEIRTGVVVDRLRHIPEPAYGD